MPPDMRPKEPTVGVRYIGHRPYWRDKPSLYRSGLDFDRGQARRVPESLARCFLKHKDLFEPAEALSAEDLRKSDDAQVILDEADKRDEEKERREEERYILMNEIERMTEQQLVGYAMDNFQVQLKVDRRKKEETRLQDLRSQVREHVDQFGVPGLG